jgi:hypothetical protein
MLAASSISKYRTVTVMNHDSSQVEKNQSFKFWRDLKYGELATRFALCAPAADGGPLLWRHQDR